MKTKRKILGVDTAKLLKDSRLDENILGHIPDFKIEEAVEACINLLAQHAKSHILMDKSKDPVQRSQAIENAHKALHELKLELLDKVQEKMFGFTRR